MNLVKVFGIFKTILALAGLEALLFQILLYNKVIYTNNTERDLPILDKFINGSFLFLILCESHINILRLWCGLKLTFASSLDKAKSLSMSSLSNYRNNNLSLENGSTDNETINRVSSLLTYEGVYYYTKKHFPWIILKPSNQSKPISPLKAFFSSPIILIIIFILFFINLLNQAFLFGISIWDTRPIFSYPFFPAIITIGVVSGTLKDVIPNVMLSMYQESQKKKEANQEG